MFNNLIIVRVNSEYCDYLRIYDNKVPYNFGIKELRPFIGVLFEVNSCEYFAPLSSPKPKHIHIKSNMDLIKIDEGKLGVINLNNMIPVTKNNYEIFDLSSLTGDLDEIKRRNLLKTQLRWLNSHRDTLYMKAFKLYTKYKNDCLPERIRARCCNFELLEEKCIEYNEECFNCLSHSNFDIELS